MPASSAESSPLRLHPSLWRRLGWMAPWLAALALVAGDAVSGVRYYTRISAIYGVAVNAPEPEPASLTGFADGRRTIVYPGSSVDGLHWLMQTQQMVARGEVRVRHVFDDNAPAGREVHWGSPFRWWLAFCGWIDHVVTGRGIGQAIEHAGLWANPALLILLLLALVPWIARRWGGAAAASLAVIMVSTPAFTTQFAGNNPDHHGLIQAAALVCLVALVLGGSGWVRAGPSPLPEPWTWLPSAESARGLFGVSGAAGAIGMWVSAVGTIPALCGIAGGALLSARLGRGGPAEARLEPALWRFWGRVGGVVTLVCYLVEHAPADLGLRLEVNHPLYALAWAGAGEILATVTGMVERGGWRLSRRDTAGLVLGLGAAAIPAGWIAARGTAVFAVADPFLWSLSHEFVPEGRSLFTAVAIAGWSFSTVAACLPVAAGVIIALRLAAGSTPPLARAVVALPLAATLFFWVLALRELRWWTVATGFLLVAVTAAMKVLAGRQAARREQLAAWVILVLCFGPGLVEGARAWLARAPITADDILSLAERDLAHALRRRVGSGPLVVLAAPATTTRMLYFGGTHGLDTPYWENLDGMKGAAAIFAARDADEARARMAAAGVTHVVLLSWDDFVVPYIQLARGLSASTPVREPAFGTMLLGNPEPPPWLRRVRYPLPQHPVLQDKHVLVFEVTDRTRTEDVLARRVNGHLERGEVDGAASLAPELARFPDDLAAQLALARIARARRDATGFTAALERLQPLLGQSAELDAEDRVGLVVLFAQAGLTTRAREVLASVMSTVDEPMVRRLPDRALLELLILAERLGVAWPSPGMRELAVSVLPPGVAP